MSKVLRLVFWIIVLAVLAKVGLWAYENLTANNKPVTQREVLDIDKDCRMDADSGSCICRHRRSGERLKIEYAECVSLVRGN